MRGARIRAGLIVRDLRHCEKSSLLCRLGTNTFRNLAYAIKRWHWSSRPLNGMENLSPSLCDARKPMIFIFAAVQCKTESKLFNNSLSVIHIRLILHFHLKGLIMENIYPIQIQADNINAEDCMASVMVHVFDVRSETKMYLLLAGQYSHVISWDKDGNMVYESDKR